MSHLQIGKGKIYDNVYDTIGNTPLVRLNKLPEMEGIKCEILCKLEFMNPGGSVKDRIGKEMFEVAEKEGKIKPGDTIIEATSGNTGIGVGLLAACKGYRCIIVLPEKMSQEKVDVLKGLGCEIVRTPTEANTFDHDSHVMTARRLRDEIPNAYILDQYNNENNWKAHYKYTAKEILVDTDNKLDYFVAGAGTGGTMTGCSKRIKEVLPDCKIIAADPYGSILADPEDESQSKYPSYQVEGIGYDFIPKNCERDQVDHWVKVDDHDAYRLARGMLKEEGFFCGGSCGSALSACFKFIKENNLQNNSALRFVVVLPDSIRNYMTKHLSDEWLVKKNFMPIDNFQDTEHPLHGKTAEILELKNIPHYDQRLTIGDALDCFKNGDKLIPLIENQQVKGVLTEDALLSTIISKKLNILSNASKALSKEFVQLPYNTDLSIVHRLLNKNSAVLLEKKRDDNTIEGLYCITLKEIVDIFRNQMKEQLLTSF